VESVLILPLDLDVVHVAPLYKEAELSADVRCEDAGNVLVPKYKALKNVPIVSNRKNFVLLMV
jgi:hypothetical protein